jgi:hypothetical protein
LVDDDDDAVLGDDVSDVVDVLVVGDDVVDHLSS